MGIKSSKIFVRSILDLGDYNDDEKNELPSLTDESCDEPIERLVARMLRGEMVVSSSPVYDTDSSVSVEDVFSRQSEVTKRGFDLADAPRIVSKAKKAIKSLSKPKEDVIPPPATPPPSRGS